MALELFKRNGEVKRTWAGEGAGTAIAGIAEAFRSMSIASLGTLKKPRVSNAQRKYGRPTIVRKPKTAVRMESDQVNLGNHVYPEFWCIPNVRTAIG